MGLAVAEAVYSSDIRLDFGNPRLLIMALCATHFENGSDASENYDLRITYAFIPSGWQTT